VRAALAIGIDAAARVLNERRHRLQPSVRADWQHAHAAAAIVRDEHVAPVGRQAQMRRPAAP